MIYSCKVHQFVGVEYDIKKIKSSWGVWIDSYDYSKPIYRYRELYPLEKGSAYTLIFGEYQDKENQCFLDNFKGKILYTSPKAYNNQYSDNKPHNTLVVFEKGDEPS